MAAEPLHLQDALAVVHGHASPLPASEVPLTEAVGHVLAADAVSALDLPPFANSAMDGFAVRASDCSGATPEAPVVLKLSGESRAGQPAQIALEGGCAMPISTGAVMPLGGDAVLRVEDAVIADGQLSITQSLPTGHDVRPAGDDISSGQTVVPAGSMIGAGELAMLAAIGMHAVQVRPLPRVAIVATGDELAVPGQQLQPGQIYDSNSYMLGQLVREAGAVVSNVHARVADNFDTVLSSINSGLKACDVLVICGGVSKGEHDHVKPALQAAGVEQMFWQVALRPGHPTWFGTKQRADGGETLVFGLPGNPVSAYVTFQLFVRAAINGLVSANHTELTLPAEYRGTTQKKKPGFTQALRCKLSNDGEKLIAEPTSNNQRSHALSSVVASDGLVLLPPESGGVTSGDSVVVHLV